MILSIATFIAGLFGVKDILKIQKWMSIGVALAVITAVLIVSVVIFKACGKRKAALTAKQTVEAQIAVEQRNDEKLRTILAEADTADDNIDAGIKQAELNTANAKKNYDGLTTDELATEIERRKTQ